MSDWLLAFYYHLVVTLNLTNRYKYDEFLGKEDFYYDFEKVTIALNLNSHDSPKIVHNYMKVFSFITDQLCDMLSD